MSNVTGFVFKSHFRLNIIIFIRNVICHCCLGPLKARNLDDVEQHCYKWRPVRTRLQMRARPYKWTTVRRRATNGRPSEDCYKWATVRRRRTNGRPSEETRSIGRLLQMEARTNGVQTGAYHLPLLKMGAPPKTAEEDNCPPKRTTVRRRGQPSAEEDNRPPKRTTENWTLSNRPRNRPFV